MQTTAEEKIRMVERQYEKYALDSNAEVAKNHENIDTWNRIENIVYKMMSKGWSGQKVPIIFDFR